MGVIGNGSDFETMVVVGSGDLELNFDPGLNINRRRRILVLLGRKFDDLNILILR